jgi:hypothetical protein
MPGERNTSSLLYTALLFKHTDGKVILDFRSISEAPGLILLHSGVEKQ